MRQAKIRAASLELKLALWADQANLKHFLLMGPMDTLLTAMLRPWEETITQEVKLTPQEPQICVIWMAQGPW